MIKQMRKKFVLIIMTILIIFIGGILVFINVSFYQNGMQKSYSLMKNLARDEMLSGMWGQRAQNGAESNAGSGQQTASSENSGQAVGENSLASGESKGDEESANIEADNESTAGDVGEDQTSGKNSAAEVVDPRQGDNRPPEDNTFDANRVPAFHIFGDFREKDVSVFTNEIYGIMIDSSGGVMEKNSLTRISNDELSEELDSLIERAQNSGKKKGRVERYCYYKQEKPYGEFMVLMDCSADIYNSRSLLISSIAIGLISLIILLVISIALSKFITRPAEEAFIRQKQFISDASHELKTPLSTITVNADALRAEIGDNRKLGYIQSESLRMKKLISELLSLASMDDGGQQPIYSEFDICEALYQIVLPFESVAYEQGIDFNYSLQENLHYKGDEEKIKQVAAVLLDNAFRHTPKSGKISAVLSRANDKITLYVYNTGEGIASDDIPHIFERFYRCDTARVSGSDSYGLGLAIAKSIVEAHGGTLKAESNYGAWAKFTATFK